MARARDEGDLKQPFDLILLDIMISRIDGYGVCEVIRQESSVPTMRKEDALTRHPLFSIERSNILVPF